MLLVGVKLNDSELNTPHLILKLSNKSYTFNDNYHTPCGLRKT